MVKQIFPCSLALILSASAWADTVVLKDQASINGKVLAEKHDQVVVDLGYTTLTVPRNQIVKISRGGKEESIEAPATPMVAPQPPAHSEKPAPQTPASFYTAPTQPSLSRTVRD